MAENLAKEIVRDIVGSQQMAAMHKLCEHNGALRALQEAFYAAIEAEDVYSARSAIKKLFDKEMISLAGVKI